MSGPRDPGRIDPAPSIRRDIERVDAAVVQAAAALPTATLHEAGGKIGVMPHAIKPVAPGMRLAGPAVTVHGPAGDNLWLHRAIDAAQAGDVLVVSVSGGHAWGYWGEVMTTACQVRGLAGLVIDGCVRDGELLGRIGWPVFARGLCIRGTGKDFGAAGTVNAPTLFEGLTVHPGDLVVGDADGVVVLPRLRAADVLAAAQAREANELRQCQRLQGGETTLQIFGWD